jgi:hypothetical protein
VRLLEEGCCCQVVVVVMGENKLQTGPTSTYLYCELLALRVTERRRVLEERRNIPEGDVSGMCRGCDEWDVVVAVGCN